MKRGCGKLPVAGGFSAQPLRLVGGFGFALEGDLPRVGQCFGMLALEKINQLLAHLAAQVEA